MVSGNRPDSCAPSRSRCRRFSARLWCPACRSGFRWWGLCCSAAVGAKCRVVLDFFSAMYTNHDTLSFCMVDVLQQSCSWSLTATSLRCIYRDAFGRSSKGEKSFFRKRCGAFGAPLPYTFGIGTHFAKVQGEKKKMRKLFGFCLWQGAGMPSPWGGEAFRASNARPYGRTCEFCAAIRSRAGRGTPKNFPRS